MKKKVPRLKTDKEAEAFLAPGRRVLTEPVTRRGSSGLWETSDLLALAPPWPAK